MRPNQGFRVAHMAARTSKDGTVLAIAGKRGTTTLSEFEADRLCRWLISLLEIDVAIQEAALGRLAASIERIATQMGHLFAQGQIAAKANLVPGATLEASPPKRPVVRRKRRKTRQQRVLARQLRKAPKRTKHAKQRRKR